MSRYNRPRRGHCLPRDRFGLQRPWLLETAWVLRKLYGFEEHAVCGALEKLLGLENIHTEDEAAARAAFALTNSGLEFADAIHLSSRPAGVAFHSFDQKLVRRAKRAGAEHVSEASGTR